ncbi:MAG: hypothetical protein ACI9KE_002538 [Polyangiales bacterium]|jgi:hypothetical protein
MKRLALALTLTTLGISSTAWAGAVRGQLAVGNQTVPESQQSDHYWNAWNGFIAAREMNVDLTRELSVVLRGGEVAEPVDCEYTLHGGDLGSRTMVVKTGARIRLMNGDGAVHELAIEGLSDEGATLPTAPGNARQLTIPAGGPYIVTDALYAHVQGTIVPVDDLAACGRVAADGAFTLPEVPPGDYVLAVYRNGEQVHEQNVTLEAGVVEVDRISLD